jgi:hypothetical protein
MATTKKDIPESKDVTEPVPGMLDPISQAKKDAKDAAAKKAKEKQEDPYMKAHDEATRFKKGGCVKMAMGGTASSRADGCAQRGKTKGKVV